jgi:hypothetical protein
MIKGKIINENVHLPFLYSCTLIMTHLCKTIKSYECFRKEGGNWTFACKLCPKAVKLPSLL